MAQYRISGVWKDSNNVITHYAFHTKTDNGYTRATKKTKTQAILLLETLGNSAKTWLWSYKTCFWSDGENIEVVNGTNGKYLRSDPNNRLTDNLGHLIDYDWISSL
jgi:hypothetical protein